MAIITISRGSLSGGALLAQKLGKHLGYEVISREVILEAAQTYGVSQADLVRGLESPPGLWERLVGKRERYILAIQAALADLVHDGNVIYHGLAGHLLLRDLPDVIKLRLIAPIEFRAQAAMVEHALSHEQAVKHIEEADAARALWVRRLYNAEWTDPALYDLILNLSHMGIETATELALALVRSKEASRSPLGEQVRHDFALRCRIRAALTFKSDFHDRDIQTSVKNGIVHLTGGPSFEANRLEIVSFVKNIPGVQRVTPDEAGIDTGTTTMVPTNKMAADIMIPLASYPHIEPGVTIREAMMALGASSVVLKDGHMVSPRYVLVLDAQHRLAGVIGRRNLLRGLIPQLRSMDEARQTITATTGLPDVSIPVSLRWNALFGKTALAASWEPVETIMAPIRGTVNADDTLSTVVTTMIKRSIDLVPVIDGERVAGVILMTDVFDSVAQFILEEGTEKPNA